MNTATKTIVERPILFSGPMVKAILEGRKTQTRRVVKKQPTYTPKDCWSFYFKGEPPNNGHASGKKYDGWKVNYTPTVREYAELQMEEIVHGCPYGKPGDRLWVRETFLDGDDYPCHPYHTDEASRWDYRADAPAEIAKTVKWKPSIFMPRVASRINLEITNVRVERLNDISEEDAKAEGILNEPYDEEYPFIWRDVMPIAVANFHYLWDKINGKKYPWASNPWIWVVEFKRVN